MRTHNKRTRLLIIIGYIISFVCVLFPLLSLVTRAAVYPNTGSNLPKVNTPGMMLSAAVPSSYTDRSVEGLFFQSEPAEDRQFVGQPYGYWYSIADQPITESTIPSNLVTPVLTAGWFGENTNNMMGRFVGSVNVTNRKYYSFNLALNFDNIPMTQDYTNFQIYFHIRNCKWQEASTDPGDFVSGIPLRIDTADVSLIGMGYWAADDIFVNVGSTSVKRNGNDWVRIDMTVPNSQLHLVNSLRITLNGTPATTESQEKQGVLLLDFDFSSLVIYPSIFDANYMTTDRAYNLFYQLLYGEFIPSGDIYDDLWLNSPNLNATQGTLTFFNNGINTINDRMEDMINVSQFINKVGTINNYIYILLTFGLFVMVTKAILVR